MTSQYTQVFRTPLTRNETVDKRVAGSLLHSLVTETQSETEKNVRQGTKKDWCHPSTFQARFGYGRRIELAGGRRRPVHDGRRAQATTRPSARSSTIESSRKRYSKVGFHPSGRGQFPWPFWTCHNPNLPENSGLGPSFVLLRRQRKWHNTPPTLELP